MSPTFCGFCSPSKEEKGCDSSSKTSMLAKIFCPLLPIVSARNSKGICHGATDPENASKTQQRKLMPHPRDRTVTYNSWGGLPQH
jgi:hypothetical protein